MGELFDKPGDTEMIKNIKIEVENPEKEFPTDVEGVHCNSVVKHGNIELPCFTVSKSEFFQNMTDGRKRLRFKAGTNVQQYMRNTRYNRPFYIKTTDNGKTYQRKIK
jgi:hypothetical protein